VVPSVIAVISTLLLSHVSPTELNDNFRIDTLYGDANLINDVFEINVIRQEGTNNFSRVVLTTEDAEIIPIDFDPRHQLNDRQLENREFYRGTHPWQRNNRWSGAQSTENFTIMTLWDRHTTTRILNVITGDITSISDGSTGEVWYHNTWFHEFFLEQNGELFRILAENSRQNATIYRVNFTTGRMEYQFSFNETSDEMGSWFVTQNGLYFYEHGQLPFPPWVSIYWDPETQVDTFGASENPLYALNFNNRTLEPRPSPIGIHNGWARASVGDFIIMEGVLAYNDNDELNVFDGTTLINLETGQRHILTEAVSLNEPLDNYWSWREPTEFHGLGDFLIGTNRPSQFRQYIIIYDLNTLEKIYHGRITLRRDQGLLFDNWSGWISGFEVNLR